MDRATLRGIVGKLAHRGSIAVSRKTSTHRHRFQPRTEDLEERALLSAGDLDPTFGSGGKTITDFGGDERGTGLVRQPDGKFVVVGVLNGTGTTGTPCLARYKANGSLDTSFGSGGTQIADLSGLAGGYSSVALQPDGKIVAGGSFNGSTHDWLISRFLPSGQPDPSFGVGGTERIAVSYNIYSSLWAIQIQTDGKIVAAGYAGSYGSYDFTLARLNANGSLDDGSTSDSTPGDRFGTNGIVTTDFGGADVAWALTIQNDGKIVAAGSTGPANPGFGQFALARYNTDGSPDGTFGSGGKVVTSFPAYARSTSVLVQPDGKIVAGGASVVNGGAEDFAIARYKTDGSPDPGFGTNGKQTLPFDVNPYGYGIKGMALQSDGMIVAAGITSEGTGGENFGLARFDSHGMVDTSFGTSGNGKVITDFSGQGDEAAAVTIQPDGNIVVAGYASSAQTGPDFAIARYLPGQSVGTNYNAATDFSTTSNPNGAWSYGYSTSLGSPLVLGISHGKSAGIDYWVNDYTQTGPSVTHNGASYPVTFTSAQWQAGQLGFHPGPHGENGLIRFTAPRAGSYSVLAEFTGINFTSPTTTDVHILDNARSIFDGNVYGFGPGSGPSYSATLSLLAGETIDFAVGYGSNGNFGGDTTGLSASIQFLSDPIVTVSATAYQMVKAPFDSSTIPVPPTQNINPGIGIRPNTDDDNNNGTPDYLDGAVTGEHDLIRVNLSTSLLLRPENLRYSLRRESVSLQAWDNPDKSGTPIFAFGSLTSGTFDLSGVDRSIWVEWASPDSGTSSIVLQATVDGFVDPLSESKISFFSDITIPNARDLGTLDRDYIFHDSFHDVTSNNDYTKFQILDPSMVNVALSSDRIDSDVRLYDITGTQIIDSSQHTGLAGDSISRILQPGTYYVQVFSKPLEFGDDYTISLSATPLSSSVVLDGIISREGSGNIEHVRLKRIDNHQIVASSNNPQHTTTWLVIHGREDNPDPPGPGQSPFAHPIGDLAQAIDGFKPDDQVLTLDWRESAHDNVPHLFGLQGASWIRDVAQWTTHALSALGIHGADLNLVGHSWGSFVAYEIAKSPETHGVHSLVVLDPAKNVPLANDYPTSEIIFSSVADWSWAFEGSFFGSEPLAATAKETFATIVPGRASLVPFKTDAETHSNVIRLFSTIVRDSNKDPNSKVSSHFSLWNLLIPKTDQPWTRDALPGHVGYEALIQGQFDEDETVWHPRALQYVQRGVGVRESVTPNSVGSYIMYDYVGDTKATAREVTDPIIGPPRSVAAPLVGSRTFANWVGTANPSDYYKFTIDPKYPIFRLKLDGGAPGLPAYLYYSNGIPVFYNLLGVPTRVIVVVGQAISIKLPPGRYYVQVAAQEHTDDPYTLSFAATLDRPAGVLAASIPEITAKKVFFASQLTDVSASIHVKTNRDAENAAARSKTPARMHAKRHRLGTIPYKPPSVAPMAK